MVNLFQLGPIFEDHWHLENVTVWIFLGLYMLTSSWFALFKHFDVAHESGLLCSRQKSVHWEA